MLHFLRVGVFFGLMLVADSLLAANVADSLLAANIAAEGATVPDSIAQRAMACSRCHAAQDKVVANAYYPRLAGKPALYLQQQMQHFRDGRRRNPLMMYMLRNMPDAYLAELAEYFSSQTPEYRSLAASGSVNAAQLARGEQLAKRGDQAKDVPACIACHGAHLQGRLPAIPGLIGLPRDYVNAQLGAWQSKIRHSRAPDCMASIAAKLSQDDISAVSAWLAAQNLTGQHGQAALPAQPSANTATAVKTTQQNPASPPDVPLPLRCGSQEVASS